MKKPTTVAGWEAVLTFIEWFDWLLSNHEPAQIVKAMKAATESLK